MDKIKYHPLITDGISPDLIPLFSTTDSASVANNRFYLEEIITFNYRLYSKNFISAAEASKYQIHCPCCGTIMKPVTSSIDGHKHALYRCNKC